MGVTFCAVAAEHPLATRAAARSNPALGCLHRRKNAKPQRRSVAGRLTWRRWKEEGRADRHLRPAPGVAGERVEAWVGAYVLMSCWRWRGDGRWRTKA